MLVKSLQPRNAQFPMVKSPLLGSVRLVNAQPWNASAPMEVTLSGIVILVKPLSSKASSPMVVIPFAMMTVVRLLPANALFPMPVTGNPSIVPGIVNVSRDPMQPFIVIDPLLGVQKRGETSRYAGQPPNVEPHPVVAGK